MPGLPTRPDASLDPDRVDLLRRRIMAVVGHELRTPVTTLRGIADELVTCDEPDRRATLVTALHRGAARLEHLVDDLLVAGSVETALPVEEAADVDLADVAARSWRDRTGDDVTVTGRAVARARPRSVRRAVDAVVDNAVRYGEPPFAVTVGHEGGRAVLSVTSGGEPPSEADLELACEAFYRGEQAVMRAPGRLGIGLAVARALVRAEGGDVVIGGREGVGVEATITLPEK